MRITVSTRLDVLQASEAAVSEDVRSVGIYRDHVIAAAAEFFEERDAEAAGLTGYPHHRNAFLGEEVVDYFERDIAGHVPS
jgi:hypothetical protein